MLRGEVLNTELNRALAAMGHGDVLIVCDAGFPIPSDAWRIDLAITQDFPPLLPVLENVAGALIAEKVLFGQDVVTNNPPLHRELQRIFADAELAAIPHATIMTETAARAKEIVRTGGFTPWGNVALVSGVDPLAWFADPALVVPPVYQKRIERIRRARGAGEGHVEVVMRAR